MQTWHIHIQGQVQGVGFRPFVYRLAHEFGLRGWVHNTLDGVHIRINAMEEVLQLFCEALWKQAPPLSRIQHLKTHRAGSEQFTNFQIIHSEASGIPDILLTPDAALCPSCRKDIRDPENRRYQYAFTTCIHCGPRFSIIRALPYDRDHTGMMPFKMCATCLTEYESPTDRRYYSQTNSCERCGVHLFWWENGQEDKRSQKAILKAIPAAWADGKIVAIKGIGGYLLTCDASQPSVIRRLRQRKHRPTKPFALMFPGMDHIRQFANLTETAKGALSDSISPIVLLPLWKKGTDSLAFNEIAPALGQVGVMIPYTPLYQILLDQFQHPIVATSGNVSESPIVYQDQQALADLSSIADVIITHNRAIETPQDDSVLTFSPKHQLPIWLRRSRGLAPTYLETNIQWPPQTILATGAMLKSTFALLHRGKVFLSQYLGNLDQYQTQEHYHTTRQHLCRTLSAEPSLVLADTHPEYPSTRMANDWSSSWQVPMESVQHHQAHFGAILGEHHLLDVQDSVLGLIWDGTGLGEDGHIWGGECFLYKEYQFERLTHFAYFDAILGDKMPKEPRIAALSASFGLPGAEECLRHQFTDTEWSLYLRMLSGEPELLTSSAGRLFDAVAAILQIKERQTYEGEAAILLEQHARAYVRSKSVPAAYPIAWQKGMAFPVRSIIQYVINDHLARVPVGQIAARFHRTLADLIRLLVQNFPVQRIACSGGVFQNGLLLDMIRDTVPAGCTLYFHERLSPNDENIAFGQLVCHLIRKKRDDRMASLKNKHHHVLSNTR